MTDHNDKQKKFVNGLILGVASDHGGYDLKQEIVAHLQDRGYQIQDFGCYGKESVDYPDYAEKLTDHLVNGKVHYGVLICGTGQGVAISANKVPGIRAAVCHDCFSAKMTRAHNNANVLTMGQRVIGTGLALEIVDSFLATTFQGGRHAKRVDKITKIEHKYSDKGE